MCVDEVGHYCSFEWVLPDSYNLRSLETTNERRETTKMSTFWEEIMSEDVLNNPLIKC